MKKIIGSVIIFCFLSTATSAQLAHTSWKCTLNLDNPLDAYFNFSSDTLEVLNAEDSSSLETMKYSVQDSVLTIQKLFGQSMCDTDSIAKYKFEIKADEMVLSVVTDDCGDRSHAIDQMKLTRIK